jgi:hypothetical protein
MMQIEYAGGSILTSDEVADAVVRYAAALAVAGGAVAVDVPGITVDGLPGTFKVLLGPSSQILAEPTARSGEIDGGAFLDEVTREIDNLERPNRALPFSGTPPVSGGGFYLE